MYIVRITLEGHIRVEEVFHGVTLHGPDGIIYACEHYWKLKRFLNRLRAALLPLRGLGR